MTARPLTGRAWSEVASLLSPAEQALFRRYSANDQRHAYRVLCTVREQGEDDPALLSAALLHDIGKCEGGLNILERSLVVLLSALAPARTAAWGAGVPAGWQRPFVVKARHAEWGARLAAAAGSDADVVALIRHHQDNLDATDAPAALLPALRRLQWADDQH